MERQRQLSEKNRRKYGIPMGRFCASVFLVLALAVLLGGSAFAAAESTEAGEAGAALEMQARPEGDSLVAQVFANMVNEAAARPPLAEGESWVDPSLEEYPLDPHELKEYGASPRVRLLVEMEDQGPILEAMERGTLDLILEREPNYLVYRDTLLLISQEEAADYALDMAADRRSALLKPAISPEELEGKTGVVLLGANLSEDRVLLLDGTPERTEEGLRLPLADPLQVKLTQLFSDGNLNLTEEDLTTQMTAEGPVLTVASSSPLKGAKRVSPTRTRASFLPDFSDLIQYTVQSPSGAWTAKMSHVSPDLDRCSVSPDVNIKKLRFNLKLTLAVKADFDIQTRKATPGRESVRVVSIPIRLPYGFSLLFDYRFVAEFGSVPLHMTGTMRTQATVSFGLSPGSVQGYRNEVSFTSFEIGENGGYFSNSAYANQDIQFYIGTELSGSVEFLHIEIDLWLFDIDIGPLVDLTLTFRAGTSGTARWEKDLLDPAHVDRSRESLHVCTQRGKKGCLSISTVERGSYDLSIGINLYVYSGRYRMYSGEERVLANQHFYHSLTYESGLREGYCSHLFYHVPVFVYSEQTGGIPMPLSGYTVYPWEKMDIDAELAFITRDVTNASGKASIFLPYQAGHRYEIMAVKEDNPSEPSGSGKQLTAMKRGVNDLVPISIWNRGQKRVRVKVSWDIDLDGLDRPDRVVAVLEKWQNGAWQRVDTLGLNGMTTQPWTGTFFISDLYTLEDGNWVTIPYRVREVSDQDILFSDYQPIEEGGTVVFPVDAWVGRNGEMVSGGETRYQVHYSENDDMTEVNITNTAVYDVSLYKKWVNVPEELRPKYVYLTLMGIPREGWTEALSLEEGANVLQELLPLMNPLSGATLSLGDLIRSGDLDLKVPSIPEAPIALIRVDGDGVDENGLAKTPWSGSLRIRKYQQGIPQKYVAAELNAEIVSRTLLRRFGIQAPVNMPEAELWVSIPGEALPVVSDTALIGTVVNAAPGEIPDPEKHIIGGVKYWRPGVGNPAYPESIQLRVYEVAEDGSRKEATGSPVTVSRPADAAAGADPEIWPWTLGGTEIDAGKRYEAEEVLPADVRNQYSCERHGLNLINTWIGNGGAVVRVHKAWDRDLTNVSEEPNIRIILKRNGSPVASREIQEYFDTEDLEIRDVDPATIGQYSAAEENRGSLQFYPVYSGPKLRIENGKPIFTFTVLNMLQRTQRYTLIKIWNTGTRGSQNLPAVSVDISANGTYLQTVTFRNPEKVQDSVQEMKQVDLPRLNSSGVPCYYTFAEQEYDEMLTEGKDQGFRTSVDVRKSQVGNNRMQMYQVLIRNDWVSGEQGDLVTVQGTVRWEESAGLEGFRPPFAELTLLNNRFETIRYITVSAAGGWKWSVPSLPARDEEGRLINYYVVESQPRGYTVSYMADYDSETQTWTNYDESTGKWINYNEDTHTWTCDVKNNLTGYFALPVEKVLQGTPGQQEDFVFNVKTMSQHRTMATDEEGNPVIRWTVTEEDDDTPLPMNPPLTITGAGEKKLEFSFSHEGIYFYTVTEKKGGSADVEYDMEVRRLMITVTPNDEGQYVFGAYVLKDPDKDGKLAPSEFLNARVEKLTFTNRNVRRVRVMKEWDIDLEKKDRPAQIQVAVQTKKDDQWETAEIVELNEENGWTTEVSLDNNGTEWRAREMKDEDGILAELKKLAKSYGDQGMDRFGEWLEELKGTATGNEYFNKLPSELRAAAEEGIDKLAEKLNTEAKDVYEALLKKIDQATAADRIVYDQDDSERTEEGKPSVSYKVPAYESVLTGGEVKAHKTKYYVSYKQEDAACTITNQAVMELSVVKRWLMLGEAEQPDSAWIVLEFKPAAGALEKAGSLPGAAGVDLSSLKDFELPTFSLLKNKVLKSGLLSGGINPLSLLSELTIGVDIDVFGLVDNLLTVGIQKVNEDNGWTASFVHTKYMLGVPIEFKGAELSSEILRLLVKYILKTDIPVSYNVFSDYISIPGKAYADLLGEVSVSSLFDLDDSSLAGKLTGALLGTVNEKLNELIGQIVPAGTPLGIKDWQRVANVVNIKLSLPEDHMIRGAKHWLNDTEQDRPETLTILLKQGDTVAKRIVLNKSDFGGSNTWSWSVDPTEEGSGLSEDETYTAEEEYPAEYDHSAYATTVSGLDIYNTRDAVTVAGRKTWADGNNRDGKRPEKIRIYLLRDGVRQLDSQGKPVHSVETSEASGWQWIFANLPKMDPVDGHEYKYTIEEEFVPAGGSAPDGTGEDTNSARYRTETDGYSITNTWVTEISGKKIWNDAKNQDGKRPNSVTLRLKDGEKIVQTLTVYKPAGEETNEWLFTFSDVPKYNQSGGTEYTLEEDLVEGYTASYDGYTVTNTHIPEKITVSGTKTWDDNKNQDGRRPKSITIRLYANGSAVSGKVLTVSVPSDQEGTCSYSFADLEKYSAGKEINYTIQEDPVEEYVTSYIKTKNGFDIINKHAPDKVNYIGIKFWDDDDDRDGKRPTAVDIQLLADGQPVEGKTAALKADNNWMYTFTDLDENSAGKAITYMIEEKEYDGYTLEYFDLPGGRILINTHAPEKITVSGTKTWNDSDNQDGIRPESITVYLVRVDNPGETNETRTRIESRTVTEADNWAWSFKNLYKYENGAEIIYAVEEEPVPFYKTAVNGYNITNTHEPWTFNATGEKWWLDNGNQDGKRPESITIHLWADDTRIEDRTVIPDAQGDWRWNFGERPTFRNGRYIDYRLTEDAIEGYETYTSGLTILNVHIPELITVSGSKTWDDANNRDGKRPEAVTVHLLKNGRELDSRTVTEKDGWSWSFEDLPRYEEGAEIAYTVTEDEVLGYTSRVDGYNVTNTHAPETVDVSGRKIWDDAEDQDGVRPDSITIRLLADGEETDVRTVTTEDGWSWIFAGLPRYDAGREIAYTIAEDEVPGYTSAVDGYNVTNTHVPAVIDIEGSKLWLDGNDQDGLRPESVTVRLWADGKEMARRTVTPDAEGNWTWKFEGLAEYRQGEKINYTLTEDPVTETDDPEAGYASLVLGYDILNLHFPETTEISGRKTWVDQENQDGIRPAAIVVRLLADGEEKDRRTVVGDDWSWRFEDLPKYDGGREIVYTLREDPVAGYASYAEGYNLTNVHVTEKTEISGRKIWDDNDNEAGARPEAVTVRLYADGTEIDRRIVTAAENWQWQFQGLDRYRRGRSVIYTLAEDPVPGYSTLYSRTAKGYDITNRYTPGKVAASGFKSWADDEDRDRLRPEAIVIRLLADGEETDSRTVTAAEDWSWTFADLPEKRDGRDISYTIAEDPVPGYEARIYGYNVINRHEPETTDVSGDKYWDDEEDQDGLRPEAVTVNLLRDGALFRRLRVTAAENWQWRFDGLLKYDRGREIVYAITEEPVDFYDTLLAGYDVFNTHEPWLLRAKGEKLWLEMDGDERYRPESITIRLLRDGEEIDSRIVTEADGWAWDFGELPTWSQERHYRYEIREDPVEGYFSVTAGMYALNLRFPDLALYTVETYYQENGVYPEKPNVSEVRLDFTGETVRLEEEDRIPLRAGYVLDETAENRMEGVVAADGSLTLKIYFRPTYRIIFDPNGGTIEGSEDPVEQIHFWGDEIVILREPDRPGWTFLYWRGSEYQPGDRYTVTEDHTFVAEWKRNEPEPGPEPDPDPGPDPDPYTYGFTFTKKWVGGPGTEIEWTLYAENGAVVHKRFNRKIISENEWRYEAWFPTGEEYYLVETVPEGWQVHYENTGVHAGVTDRCYRGGTIINYKVPRTGDPSRPLGSVLALIAGVLGLGLAVFLIRRRKT